MAISSKLIKFFSVTALCTTLSAPVSAYAFDWGAGLQIVNQVISLFTTPDPVEPSVESTTNYPGANNNTNASSSSDSYPISQSSGSYDYVGADGQFHSVDTTKVRGQSISDTMNTDMQGINSPGFSNDGTGNTPSKVGGGNYPWPVKGGPISSSYGDRIPPCHTDDNGDGTFTKHCGSHHHNGLDIAVPSGTPVSSVIDGKVVWISPACRGAKQGEAGCAVSIMGPFGELSTYMHLSGTTPGLAVGDPVGQGQVFAKSGNTGISTGAHLHFEMCQVPPEAATGNVNALSLCKMGSRINPLTRLTTADSRYNSACRLAQKVPGNTSKLMGGVCYYTGGPAEQTQDTVVRIKQSQYTAPKKDTPDTTSSNANLGVMDKNIYDRKF